MTIARDAANSLIGEFGEEVTVIPQSSQEPEDSNDPIYFEETASSESSFTEKVRIYNAPSEEMLQDYGFDEDTEAMIYSTSANIKEADIIEYQSYRWVVRNRVTNQLGNGPYIYIYNLKGT